VRAASASRRCRGSRARVSPSTVELFTELGGFDPGYFMYWEDVDFSVRAARAGAQLSLRLDLRIEHDEGGTQRRRGRAKSNLYYAHNARNRLRFAARNVPRADRASWVRSTPAVTREIYLRGGRRQLVRSPWSVAHAIGGALGGVVLLARSRRSTA
jgi:GT2 family glycosyltransferase